MLPEREAIFPKTDGRFPSIAGSSHRFPSVHRSNDFAVTEPHNWPETAIWEVAARTGPRVDREAGVVMAMRVVLTPYVSGPGVLPTETAKLQVRASLLVPAETSSKACLSPTT